VDFAFNPESQTKNIMSNPFEDTDLPEALPAGAWHEATIKSLKLNQKDSSAWFSLVLSPTSEGFAPHDERLNYVHEGKPHFMAVKTAKVIAACIGGRIDGTKLVTADGEKTADAMQAACDAAVGKVCYFKVKHKGEYTNMVDFKMED